jgi:matrixin
VSRRVLIRAVALLAGSLGLASTGSAYYYYFFFNNGVGSPVKFDLTTLVNNRVPFYISDQGPSAVVAGDSFQAIISEIRAAAEVWNSVSTSNIRLAYGGLFTVGRADSAPSIDVEFSDDVPPGLLAIGSPWSEASPVTGPGGPFIPITRSILLLRRDMVNVPVYGPIASYSEPFFVTLVHEFGHTLGLQHTLTSSVMSTLPTTASSKSEPLGADDIAAISLLYPAATYLPSVGSISGRVTMNGTGMNLASVVVISPSNAGISTLTNPDGTYQINGIPPGQYFVYAHPLPPPLYGESSPDNIWYPLDITQNPNGVPITPNYTAFATQFYNGGNGTLNWQQAQVLGITAGQTASGINFNVSSRPFESVYAVRTYGYTQAGLYVSPAPVTQGSPTATTLAATGAGLLQSNNTITPGISISTLGSVAPINDLRPYPPPQPYIALDVLSTTLGVGPGPKHLLFATSNDLYVLPSGFNVVTAPPPFISSVTPTFDANGNRAVVIVGTTFESDTRILFDGLPGVIENVQSDGSLLVTPPQAPSSYIAPVVALNSDGQSSLFLQNPPLTYNYDPAATPSLTVSPSVLIPGADVTVSVTGVNTNFIDGQTRVGFGTSDVVIQQVTVQSPTQISVLVTPNSLTFTGAISVTTGLGVISQALGYQVVTTDPQVPPSSK